MRRVVVTGMGIVCALGNSVSEAVGNAIEGRSGFRRCDARLGVEGERLRCRVAATVEGFDPSPFIPERAGEWFDMALAYAVAASEEALKDAAIEFDAGLRDRTGVLIGASAPGCGLYHKVCREVFVAGAAHKLPGRVGPMLSGNIYGSVVAMRHGFRGPTYGVVDACATGATAMSLAADAIRTGRADVVVAGGTDAILQPALMGSMLNARAINPTDDPSRPCRPFCSDRAGLVPGEGAGVVVMESLEHALLRGARIRAELCGDALTNDAHHIYAPEPEGDSWARTMRLALDAARIDVGEVDAISAHAASTPMGDRIESRAIEKVFGARAGQVPVSATKSMHGHTYGAAGAIESILALEAMRRGRLLPTIHLDAPDPALGVLDYVPNESRPSQGAQVLLKNAFGFGGTNTCLVFRLGVGAYRSGRSVWEARSRPMAMSRA